MRRIVFPFAAVLGQENIKKTLLWNLVNPRVGGVLISGEKGTAKSTLARGLAELTEEQRLVELPLNVTEDRLVGAIDLSRALKYGESALEPGLLKEADGNILYVDEVNLLSDHIVNALLETAASGRNVVEREGISCSHASRFVLVGRMNPEEGKLRPQFLDRFGLYVEAVGEKDPAMRAEIVRRRLAFEDDPLLFLEEYRKQTELLREKLRRARELLPRVEITENAMQLAASLSGEAHCCGHRAELAIVQAARAVAALDGRKMLNPEDIKEAAKYALPHRMRDAGVDIRQADTPQPEESTPQPEDATQTESDGPQPEENAPQTESDGSQQEENAPQTEPDALQQGENAPQTEPDASQPQADLPSSRENGRTDSREMQETPGRSDEEERLEESGEAFWIPRWQDGAQYQRKYQGSGRRSLVRSEDRQGRYVGYRAAGDEKVMDLAFDATVRAAAPFQKLRDKKGRAIAVEKADMRIKIREKRTGGCILFVVDASSSMGANRRMREVKAAIVSMLNVSYQKRDRVGMIAFRKDHAELLLGITPSVELAQKKLEELPTGGKTPLAAGLDLAYEVLMGLKMREPGVRPTMVLVSDGRASGKKDAHANPFADALRAAERIGNQKISVIILDTENGFLKFHLCERLNEKLRGTLLTMEELRAEGIVEAVSAYAGR